MYIALKVGSERWIFAERRLKPFISETDFEGKYRLLPEPREWI